MAVNTIDYKLTLDTSEIPIQMNNIRSQLSGMMTGPSDIAGAQMGFSQFVGAAGGAYGTMRGALDRMSDPMSIANQPNYGVIEAQSRFWPEFQARFFGPGSLLGQVPPGMGAGEYAAVLQRNWDQRIIDAKVGFARGAAPIVGGLIGDIPGAMVGRALIGGTLGTIAGGLAGWVIGEKVVSAAIERGDKIFEETQQLGEIATAGRGFTQSQQLEFGRGFRDIASRMRVSTQEMGDVVAGIRAAGMMPRTRDVPEALRQFEGMARDIRDVAVGMQTSLGRATQYLREVERMGLGRGVGGVFGAAQMAEGLGTSLGGLIAYVGQGRAIGMRAQIGAGVGGGLWLQSAFAGARGMEALTPEERLMVGGPLGLGRAFGMQALQGALGPQGQMQMLAMMGPTGAEPLPGTAFGTIEQAAGNIFGGGDPIANMIEFETNRNRMLHQVGARGIRMMQAQTIQSQAQLLMQISPGLEQQRALQWISMQQGLSEHQARAMARYIMGGFRDAPIGLPSRAGAMPAIYGGPGMAEASMRVAVDRIARETAPTEMRGPIDFLADVWTGLRTHLVESAEEERIRRLEREGIVVGRKRLFPEVARSLRTGSGFLAQFPIDIRDFGSSSAHMETVLTFAGREGVSSTSHGPGIVVEGGTISAKDAQEALSDLAQASAYEAKGRFTKKEWELLDKYRLNLGMAAHGNQLDVAQLREKFRTAAFETSGREAPKKTWTLTEAYDPQKLEVGQAWEVWTPEEERRQEIRKRFSGIIGKFLSTADPELAAEFEQRWFRGPRGPLMMRLLRDVGVDVGELIRTSTSRGMMSVVAGATVFEKKTLLEAAGLPADSNSQRFDLVARQVDSREFGKLASLIQAHRKASGTNREKISKQIEKAQTVFVSKFTRKWTEPENRKIAETLSKTAINDDTLGKNLLALAKYTESAKKKPGTTVDQPQREGMVRAFQTQGESFQSQVATSLSKTAHTLEEVRKAMTALNSKIRKK